MTSYLPEGPQPAPGSILGFNNGTALDGVYGHMRTSPGHPVSDEMLAVLYLLGVPGADEKVTLEVTMPQYLYLPCNAEITGNLVVDGSLTASGGVSVAAPVDWINVILPPYSADKTGTTDSTTAIRNAISAAAPGQPVYLPAGIYKTTSPIDYTGGVITGDSGYPFGAGQGTVIRAAASFSGTAILTNTSTSGTLLGGQLYNITIDGSSATGSVAGIVATGSVENGFLENVFVYKPPGNGIDVTQSNSSGHPYGWHWNHVKVDTAGGHGIVHGANHTDGALYDVHSIGAVAGHAWYINGAPSNTRFVGCRAEWAGAGFDGFHLSGSWNTGTGAGGCSFTGCSTDRNDNHGMSITATGTCPVILSGCMFRRDGRNAGSGGGSFAGLNIASATVPVVIDAITVYPGVDDTGSGTNSPQIGLNATSSSYIEIGTGYIQGATTGINQSGNTVFNAGPNVITASGTTGSPTVHTTPFLATMNAASLSLSKSANTLPVLTVTNTNSAPTAASTELVANAAADKVLGIQVTGDTSNRLVVDSNGTCSWTNGSGTSIGTLSASNGGVAVNALTGGTYLCAPKVYAPGTQTTLAVSSTTLAAFSSGTVCTNSFTAPASGSVIVAASFMMQVSASGASAILGLAATGTVTPVIGNTVTYQLSPLTTAFPIQVQFYVSGLTPGTSYQFDLLGAATSTDSATIFAFGATSTSLGVKGAPVVMTVQAV